MIEESYWYHVMFAFNEPGILGSPRQRLDAASFNFGFPLDTPSRIADAETEIADMRQLKTPVTVLCWERLQ